MTYEQIALALHTLIVLGVPRYRNSIFQIPSQPSSAPKKYRVEFDVLKGICIIAVVIIHIVYFGLLATDSLSNIWVLNYANTISRFTIGGFFFASGFLLTAPSSWDGASIRTFYGKKFLRIALPYAGVTYLVWNFFRLDESYWWLLISGKASVPFYFVPVLFQLYLLFPLLHYIRNKWPRTLLWGSFLLVQISFWTGVLYQYGNVILFGTFIFYFVFGMVRKDLLDVSSTTRRAWLEIVGWYLGIHFGLSLVVVGLVPEEPFATQIYNSQFSYAMALAGLILYWATHYLRFGVWVQRGLVQLGRLSLWIFLLHYPIQEIILDQVYTNNPFWVAVALHFVLTWVIVIPCAYVFQIIYGVFLKQMGTERVTKETK